MTIDFLAPARPASYNAGSAQLRDYRIARRDGASTEHASRIAGIPLGEARLHDAEDARNPPPDEAFVPLRITEPPKEEPAMTETPEISGELKLIVERIERLKEEQRGIGEDIRDIMAEAKGRGFDAPAIRECLRLRRMDAEKRRDLQNMVQVYGEQLGLF